MPLLGVSKRGSPFHLARPTLILSLLLAAPPAFAEQVKEGAKFEWKGSNETTHKTFSSQEIILQVDANRISTRWETDGVAGFIVDFFDKQLCVTENSNWVYAPGNCGVSPQFVK
jgi:hypothetical protein